MVQRLFVYGTLAPGRPNAHILSSIDGFWENASVSGSLHAVGWGASLGYPGIIPSETGGDVEGFLFSSNSLSDHWSRLDEFEGEAYERVLVTANLEDGGSVETYVYALREKLASS